MFQKQIHKRRSAFGLAQAAELKKFVDLPWLQSSVCRRMLAISS